MLRLYAMLKSQYAKVAMEYPLNFWMMVIAGILMRGLFYMVVFILYANIPAIPGWSANELYLMLSFMYCSEGVSALLFDGVWHIPRLIFQGSFDVCLSRPVSPLLQVVSSEIGLQGFGILFMGLFTLFASLHALGMLTVPVLLASAGFICIGSLIRLAVTLASNSFSFWVQGGSNNLAYMVHSVGEFAKYPLNVYPNWLRGILLGIVPYAFASSVPVLILKGQNSLMWIVLMIAVTVGSLLIARAIFYVGLRKYESVGN